MFPRVKYNSTNLVASNKFRIKVSAGLHFLQRLGRTFRPSSSRPLSLLYPPPYVPLSVCFSGHFWTGGIHLHPGWSPFHLEIFNYTCKRSFIQIKPHPQVPGVRTRHSFGQGEWESPFTIQSTTMLPRLHLSPPTVGFTNLHVSPLTLLIGTGGKDKVGG